MVIILLPFDGGHVCKEITTEPPCTHVSYVAQFDLKGNLAINIYFKVILLIYLFFLKDGYLRGL